MKSIFKSLKSITVAATALFITNASIASEIATNTKTPENKRALVTIQDFEKTITKNATKNDLKKIESELAEIGFKVSFSDLEYNTLNEITGITVKYGGQNSNSGSYSVSSENPINTIIISSKNGSISLKSVGTSGNSAVLSQGKTMDAQAQSEEIEMEFQKKLEEMDAKRQELRAEMAEKRKKMQEEMDATMEKNEKSEAEYQAKRNEKLTTRDTNSIELDKDELNEFYEMNKLKPHLIIVNGTEKTKAEMVRIEPSTIESVNILKEQSAVALYGEKAKNGAIIITTKKE